MSGIKLYQQINDLCPSDETMRHLYPDARLYVLHTDHLASHAYDEAVERAAFEAEYPDLTKKRSVGAPDVYWSAMTQNRWADWIRCAQSRARRYGDTE